MTSDGRSTPDADAPAPTTRLLPESGPHGAPSKVGRYVVLDVLGMGGMGVVCTAYDPKLDRKVALKLLRPRVREGRSSTGRARLVREAQSLAKLSHPNIVTVHDVDTTPDGRIYMAMEFVQGRTLTQWMDAEKPTWRAKLDVFEQAGRGLAAAHAANITHRDFKPANALIGEDGRVKVLDFGLAKNEGGSLSTDSDDARLDPSAPVSESASEDIMSVVQSTTDMKLTMAGRIVGTPAYMAPEQRRGRPTGPATDQFSFAVAVYEGLYGKLPYRAENHSRDAARGRILEPPTDTEVPAWVFRALRRALAPAPSDRYPSMGDFLTALRADPARRRRMIAGWVGGAVLLGGVGVSAVMLSPDDSVCQGSRSRLQGVWDAERRAVVDASLRDTATAYAAYTAERVVEGLDTYVDGWVDARTTVCEATWVHGEQSEATLDVRMHCLDRQHGELRALLDVLADADDGVVERAVGAVAALQSPQTCITADPAEVEQLPADPQRRREVLAARARIDDTNALNSAGRYNTARDVAQEALAQATATKHAPTIARALLAHGITARQTSDHDVAQTSFEAAAFEAARLGDAELEALALISQVRVFGLHRNNRERALGIAAAARSAMTRAGSPADLEVNLSQQLGATALSARENGLAIEHMRDALSAAERAYPPNDVRFAGLYTNLGIALAQRGEMVEAEAHLRRALALRESKLGTMHPQVARVAQNLANVLASRRAALPEAIELIERAMTIRRALYGAEHMKVADLRATKARLHDRGGDRETALAEFQRAAAVYRRSDAPEAQKKLASTLYNIAKVQAALDQPLSAVETASEALALFSGNSKAQREGVGRAALILCGAERKLGRLDAALEHCERAAGAIREARGETDDELSDTLAELARLLEQRGDRAGALAAAQKSVAAAQSAGMRARATEALERRRR